MSDCSVYDEWMSVYDEWMQWIWWVIVVYMMSEWVYMMSDWVYVMSEWVYMMSEWVYMMSEWVYTMSECSERKVFAMFMSSECVWKMLGECKCDRMQKENVLSRYPCKILCFC